MLDKKGQGLSTNAIILIVLGVIVLVILILGFTLGWGKIAPFVKTNNVDNIKTSCGVACSTESVYDFCLSQREVKVDGNKFFASCYDMSNKEGPNYDTEYKLLGIESCPALEAKCAEVIGG